MVRWFALSLVVLRFALGTPAMALPIFPGAVGFGSETRAAYGSGGDPTVYRVTNLDDSGAGSLRAAIEASGPRVVIFERSGTIPLGSDIYITNPYITVAGQTAPSPGITLKNYGIWIYSHDVLLQHFRIRPGDEVGFNDGLGQAIRAGVYEDGAYNIFIDHMSWSWTSDEGSIVAKTSAGGEDTTDANVTFWRCMAGEGLSGSSRLSDYEQSSAPEGKGLAVNYYSRNVSAMQNLYASVANRIPLVKGGTRTAFVNNLIYNWSTEPPTLYGGQIDPGTYVSFTANYSGNYYRTGPNWTVNGTMAGSRYSPTGSRLYMANNFRDASGGTLNEFLVINNDGIDPRVATNPVPIPGYTPVDSSDVMALVLANAGARPLDRDAVDARLVREVQNRSGRIPRSQSEVGGWPTLAVNSRALTLPDNPHAGTTTGYSNLELWLHGYKYEVEGTGSTVPIGLPHAPTSVHVAAALVN